MMMVSYSPWRPKSWDGTALRSSKEVITSPFNATNLFTKQYSVKPLIDIDSICLQSQKILSTELIYDVFLLERMIIVYYCDMCTFYMAIKPCVHQLHGLENPPLRWVIEGHGAILIQCLLR